MHLFTSLSLLILWTIPLSVNTVSAQGKNEEVHIYYYSTVKFVETPLSPIEGSVPLNKKEAMGRNHYRFAYNEKNQLVSVSFFNGDVARDPNHTANLFTLAHRMEFDHSMGKETVSFYNTQGEPARVLGNCSRFVYSHNALGYRNALHFLDEHNERITNAWGIYEYQWEYLDDGSVIEERYDAANKPVSFRPGFEFYKVRLYFDPLGHIALIQNIDKDGNLVENTSGAAQDRITTNARGNFLEWNVLNKDHELEKGNGPDVAIGKQHFDTYGYETALIHRDEHGNVIHSAYGIAKSKTVFDRFGNISERSFYNEKGSPASHKSAGYHKLSIGWDEHGNNRTFLKYFDVDNKPCTHKTRGYHEVYYEYDDQKRLTKISYLSVRGDLVNRTDNGRAYTVFEYAPDHGDRQVYHFNNEHQSL